MPRSAMPRTWLIWSLTWSASFVRVFEIGADDLDRVGAFDAGDRLLDVVLDVLREVEDDSRQLASGTPPGSARSVFPWSSPCGHWSNGLSGTNSSTLENGEASLPSSGRPCWETTVMTSGCFSRISRIFLRRRLAVLQRERHRHRGANPKIALFQLREKLAAQPRRQRTPATARKTTPMPTMRARWASAKRSAGL